MTEKIDNIKKIYKKQTDDDPIYKYLFDIDEKNIKISKNTDNEEYLFINESALQNKIPTTPKITSKKDNKPSEQMVNLTYEYMTSKVNNFTINDLIIGETAIAEYAYTHIFKDNIICIDYARKKVKYKNEDGKIVVDNSMISILKNFLQSIRKKSGELYETYKNTPCDNKNVYNTNLCIIEENRNNISANFFGLNSKLLFFLQRYICNKTLVHNVQ